MVLALLLIVCCRAQEGVIRLTISKDSALRLIRLNPFPSFPAPEGHFLPLINESPVDSSMFWKGVIWAMENKKALHDTVYIKKEPYTYFGNEMILQPFINNSNIGLTQDCDPFMNLNSRPVQYVPKGFDFAPFNQTGLPVKK